MILHLAVIGDYMKVLYIVKTNEGASWAFSQAKWLCKNGIELIVVLPQKDGGFANKYKKCGIQIIEADLSLPVNKPWLFKDKVKLTKQIVRNVKPDIIHCHFLTNILMIRLALIKNKGLPRVFQVPGPLHLENWFYRKLEIATANQNDYWIGACKKTCNIYKSEGIDNDRIFLGYYGVYEGSLVDEYYDKSGKLREQFGIPKHIPLVGMVSYFYKPKYLLLQFRGIKGHEDFIDAFSLVKKRIPEAKAIIIGGSWGNSYRYEKKIKRKALKLCGDDIIFTGFRTDIKKIYRELDVVVHPSLSENLGGAAESLTAGVPTVCTNVGGFPDIVIDDETGYLCDVKNPVDLANKVIKQLNNRHKALVMAENGKKMAKDLLDINNTAKQIKIIYKKIKKDF